MKKLHIVILLMSQIVIAKSLLEQGNFFYQKQNFKKALKVYVKASKQNPSSDLIQFNQYGEALVRYERIIDRNPQFIRAYINAGGIYTSLNEVGKALQLYTDAYSIDSSNTTVIKMLAESYLRLESREQAIKYFEEGLKLDPSDVEWSYALAEVYINWGFRNSCGLTRI